MRNENKQTIIIASYIKKFYKVITSTGFAYWNLHEECEFSVRFYLR